eukprot:GEMP01006904.1.p1 GENE.GEMP01006904.1~~GEMP01006904.1.p1  ORF type:complete len:490 (-),score=51.73 GEMP01006904.1:2014-3483(-)
MPGCCVSSKHKRSLTAAKSTQYQTNGEERAKNVNMPEAAMPSHSPLASSSPTAPASPQVLLSELANEPEKTPSPSDSFASCREIPKSEESPDSVEKIPLTAVKKGSANPAPTTASSALVSEPLLEAREEELITLSMPLSVVQPIELDTVIEDEAGVQSVPLDFCSTSGSPMSPWSAENSAGETLKLTKYPPKTSTSLDSMNRRMSGATRSTSRKRWSSFMKRSKRGSRRDSMSEDRSIQSHRVSTVTYIRRSIIPKVTKRRIKDSTKLIKSSNPNRPSDYVWMMECLAFINNKECPYPSLPLFFICGGCPSSFAGMQSVMYSWTPDQLIDYWWIKPMKDDMLSLEKETMRLNIRQPHKNDPGRSKPIYQPLADFFIHKAVHGNVRFGIEMNDGLPRAVLYEQPTDGRKGEDVLYLYLIWQEDWTSSPFARVKYLKGKMVFRRESLFFYARQFMIEGTKFTLEAEETDEFQNPFGDGERDVKDYYHAGRT